MGGGQAYRGQSEGLCQHAPRAQDFIPLQRPHRLSRTGQEPHQVAGTIESGARVCGDEAEVWIGKSTLSRTGQERQP